jgi:hypothetical protein
MRYKKASLPVSKEKHRDTALLPNVISRSSDPDQWCIVIKSALILISCQIHSIKFLGHPYFPFSLEPNCND